MSEERSDFRRSSREGARPGVGEGGEGAHPDLDRLAAFHAGELPEAEAEGVREHLSLCRECADLLLDWRDFARGEPAGAASAAAAAWERDRERIREGVRRRAGAGAGTVESQESDPAYTGRRPGRAAPWLVAAAAAVAAVVLGVLWWQARAELGRPRQVAFASVAPDGSAVLRGREDVAEVVVAPGARPVMALYLGEPGEYPRYEARIVPPGGEETAFVLELAPDPAGPFTVQLGRDPEPGDYRVVLFGLGGGERQEVATYSFRVVSGTGATGAGGGPG